MRRWTLALLLAALLLTTRQAQARPLTRWDIVTMIYHYAALYNVDAGDLLRLAMCESRQLPYPPDGSQGEVGPYQLHPRGVVKGTPWAAYSLAALRDPELNIKVAAWAVAHGYGAHWTCWNIRYLYGYWPE